MKFTKMHGLGNDYIYVNCFNEKLNNNSKVAKFVSDRHFGIGSDGLVLIMPSKVADYRMRMYNSDGSEAEMCGNAIRCVGKYVYDNKMTDKETITIETLAGIKTLEMTISNGIVDLIKVDMGEPILNPKDIPVKSNLDRYISKPIKIGNMVYRISCVSMGNPHAIIYIDNVMKFPLEIVGPQVENHELFPKKINAEFVEIIDRRTLKMRVWERGAGETLACGTGACAVLVASVLNKVCEREVTVILLGGNLTVKWDENNNHIYLTGPATFVFEGEIDLEGIDD